MNDNQLSSMDKISDGYSKGQLAAYFGAPRLDYPALSVFDNAGGVIAVLFQNTKSVAYALYDLEGKLVRAVNVKPLTIVPGELENISMKDFVKVNGNPHTDLGSGRVLPAYLGTDAKIYKFTIIGGKISRIYAISLLQTNKEYCR